MKQVVRTLKQFNEDKKALTRENDILRREHDEMNGHTNHNQKI
jgi:hypothetical protein